MSRVTDQQLDDLRALMREEDVKVVDLLRRLEIPDLFSMSIELLPEARRIVREMGRDYGSYLQAGENQYREQRDREIREREGRA
jgi:hypothetical protein